MKITITDEYGGRTIKDWLYENGVSRALITRLKKTEDGITLNGVHATVRKILTPGDILSLDLSDEPGGTLVPAELPVRILFENDELIAIDKPPRMPTHPSHGHFEDTLANGLAYIFKERGEPFVFRAINRLDRDTSGIVLVAKSQYSASKLTSLMRSGRIHKTYTAILNGVPEKLKGEIDRPIRRAENSVMLREVCEIDAPGAKSALTRYEVTESGILLSADGSEEAVSVVRAEPVTGRTHQLRVHFASLGTPIIGDGLYGTAETVPTPADLMCDRHALHASRLVIEGGGTITIESPLPGDMKRVIDAIKRKQ